ncbi:MAG: gas vesicle protein K [Planctomycetota bacterium]|nr:gas vesicle protein K [Planctomycetota bacterium]
MSGLPTSASSEIEPRGEVSDDLKSALQSLVTDEAMAATTRTGGRGRDCAENTVQPAARVNVDPEDVRKGLGRLVLTLIRLLHELMEKQAIRRMDSGSLSDAQIERLGETLMLQAREIERMRREFGLSESDLNLDLGPLGTLMDSPKS